MFPSNAANWFRLNPSEYGSVVGSIQAMNREYLDKKNAGARSFAKKHIIPIHTDLVQCFGNGEGEVKPVDIVGPIGFSEYGFDNRWYERNDWFSRFQQMSPLSKIELKVPRSSGVECLAKETPTKTTILSFTKDFFFDSDGVLQDITPDLISSGRVDLKIPTFCDMTLCFDNHPQINDQYNKIFQRIEIYTEICDSLHRHLTLESTKTSLEEKLMQGLEFLGIKDFGQVTKESEETIRDISRGDVLRVNMRTDDLDQQGRFLSKIKGLHNHIEPKANLQVTDYNLSMLPLNELTHSLENDCVAFIKTPVPRHQASCDSYIIDCTNKASLIEITKGYDLNVPSRHYNFLRHPFRNKYAYFGDGKNGTAVHTLEPDDAILSEDMGKYLSLLNSS